MDVEKERGQGRGERARSEWSEEHRCALIFALHPIINVQVSESGREGERSARVVVLRHRQREQAVRQSTVHKRTVNQLHGSCP
jgi:hypothetical protein